MVKRAKRCDDCGSRLNDPAYPLESADPWGSGTCQDCRAQRGDMQAMYNLGVITLTEYARYIQQLRSKVRG